MRPSYLADRAIEQFINRALEEDIGEGDHSSLGSVPEGEEGRARLLIKEQGILAGAELAEKIFLQYDPQLKVVFEKRDGAEIKPDEIAFTVEGNVRSILATERLVLNCMQRMSGIATYTKKLCGLLEGTGARLMDARKTTPNFRMMEKWAVHIGGGLNHRFALYDMVMLKDNHIDSAGGIRKAIEATLSYLKSRDKQLKIEVETRTLNEVREALETGGVDVIMLDNMPVEVMQEAVKTVRGQCKTEASGGITEANLRVVAETGVDYISVGALTHSVKSLDMSLKLIK